MDFSPDLLAMPAGLGALIGLALGMATARATASSIPANAMAGMIGLALLGWILAAGAGWGVGMVLKPVQLCREGGIVPSPLPHSLFLAPVLGAMGAFGALLFAARRRAVSPGAVALLWLLAIALPTAVALLFGKTTTSPNPLFRDCISVGMRLVANAALVGAVGVACVTLVMSRRR